MKFVWVLLTCATLAASAGCRSKPAYSNINVNASRGSTQAAGAQPAADGSATPTPAPQPDQPSGGGAAQAQPGPARPTAIKMPAFFDAQKGEVKDLPSYPKSQRLSLQYGPVSADTDMASLVLSAPATMDSIGAFYDKAIKAAGWEVKTRNRDSEYSEWQLKKGDTEEGRVTVKKDSAQGSLTIQIVRTSKAPEKK
ncbi:MAG TPA: hypothetical protein VFB82_11515 [Blastocatellia bacterium]|nr:hypothetical protein [Blastocatellia bacterium]